MAQIEMVTTGRGGHWPGAMAIVAAIGAAAGVGLLFWGLWVGQFAAPPGHVLGSRDTAEEAALCLLVSQEAQSRGGGVFLGSYPDEASRFWSGRLRMNSRSAAQDLSRGRARLNTVIAALRREGAQDWLPGAMEVCSRRALMYGAHFAAFDRG